jgi:hypothetical protein
MGLSKNSSGFKATGKFIIRVDRRQPKNVLKTHRSVRFATVNRPAPPFAAHNGQCTDVTCNATAHSCLCRPRGAAVATKMAHLWRLTTAVTFGVFC